MLDGSVAALATQHVPCDWVSGGGGCGSVQSAGGASRLHASSTAVAPARTRTAPAEHLPIERALQEPTSAHAVACLPLKLQALLEGLASGCYAAFSPHVQPAGPSSHARVLLRWRARTAASNCRARASSPSSRGAEPGTARRPGWSATCPATRPHAGTQWVRDPRPLPQTLPPTPDPCTPQTYRTSTLLGLRRWRAT